MEVVAKYLPVERERINPNELYFNEHGHLTAYAATSKPNEKCKKAILFAVTQDIEVGDEVVDEDGSKWIVKFENKKGKGNSSGEEIYKILGIIKPERNLKDGDKVNMKKDVAGKKEFKKKELIFPHSSTV